METVACIVLLLAFVLLVSLGVVDAFKMWKERQREELRRETVKNCLQDICSHLDNISNGIWYEK